MTFEKKHKLGALSLNKEAFDRSPVCLNVRKGVKDKLKTVPDWKERIREFIDTLVQEIEG